MSSSNTLNMVLEELHLIICSLLPGEILVFIEDSALWNNFLDSYALEPDSCASDEAPGPAHFQVKLSASSNVWFDVQLPPDSPAQRRMPTIAVKGDTLGRTEQERWQAAVAEAWKSVVDGSEYPLYVLISAHLLPQLHVSLDGEAIHSEARPGRVQASSQSVRSAERDRDVDTSPPRYHALIVSHHLKSPQKRRSLSQWSHELSLSGFAKVGYPGIIYCDGVQEDVEDFVGRVKNMQWLALRLRFIEPLPLLLNTRDGSRRTWEEFEKVGEVVDEMRRLGRENFVREMGIGSAGK